MIEYGITDEWNVQMRTSKHNCNYCVVIMETVVAMSTTKRSNFLRNVVARDIFRLYPAKSAKLTGYTTPSQQN